MSIPCSASWFIVLGSGLHQVATGPRSLFSFFLHPQQFCFLDNFQPHVRADSLHVLLKVDWSLPQTWLGKIFYAKCYLVVVCHSSTYKIVKVLKLLEKTASKDSEIIFMMIIIYFYNYYIKLFKVVCKTLFI